mgnify:CR=1 FL=1
MFPPEDPITTQNLHNSKEKMPKSIFWRLLRPEFVLSRKTWRPLSSDALSTFAYQGNSTSSKNAKDAKSSDSVPSQPNHNLAVTNATKYLLELVVPHLAKQLSKRLTPGSKRLMGNALSSTLHRHGINLRHLGLLRKHIGYDSKEIKKETKKNTNVLPANGGWASWVILSELVLRTMKHHLRQLLRETVRSVSDRRASALRERVAMFLNLVT